MSEKTNDIGPQPGPDFVRPDTPAHRWLEEANAAASSDWIDGFNKCAELRIAPSKGGPTPYFNRSMVEVHAYQYHARHPFDCLERAAEIASEADAEIEHLRARVALLEPVAAAARIYYRHYMQDEADDGGEQWCGHDQHERAKAVRDSLHDLEPFTVKELRL